MSFLLLVALLANTTALYLAARDRRRAVRVRSNLFGTLRPSTAHAASAADVPVPSHAEGR